MWVLILNNGHIMYTLISILCLFGGGEMKQLTTEQVDFFTHITSIAFVNPFGLQREQADCELLNIPLHSEVIEQRVDKIQV